MKQYLLIYLIGVVCSLIFFILSTIKEIIKGDRDSFTLEEVFQLVIISGASFLAILMSIYFDSSNIYIWRRK